MSRNGFTLVEVLIVGLVLSLVGGAILVLAQTARQVWASTDARLATMTIAQQAINRLTEDLRKACASTVACPAGELQFKRSPDCDPDGPPVTYSLVGNDLEQQEGAGAPIVVVSGLEGFAPSCPTTGRVDLTVTAQTNSIGGPSRQTVVSQVWIQNP